MYEQFAEPISSPRMRALAQIASHVRRPEDHPSLPDVATFAEAVLVVLLTGYLVERSENLGEHTTGGAVARLRQLGWPITLSRSGYLMEAPYVPSWTFALPTPLLQMSNN